MSLTHRVPRVPRRSGTSAAVLALLVLLGAGLSACGDGEPDTQGRTNTPSEATRTGGPDDVAAEQVSVSDVSTGLTSPWGLAQTSDGALLVSERDTGRILEVDPESGERRTLRTLPDVVPGGEAGLLGLALTPDEDRLLAYYTRDRTSRVVAMSWDGSTLGEPEVLLEDIPGGAGYHQGGRLLVVDDLVYVGTGDNGQPASAQDPDSLSGKVLRLTLEGDPAPGNPFGTEVFTLGHRNVEGLTVDDEGRVWAAEFGQNAWDEVNLLEAGGNYGWPEVEGSGGAPDFLDPAAVFRTEDASPAGIAFWDGSLWLAALRGARLWELPLDADGAVQQPVSHLEGELGRLRTVAAVDAGRSLLLTTSNTDGRGEPRDGDDRLLRVSR